MYLDWNEKILLLKSITFLFFCNQATRSVNGIAVKSCKVIWLTSIYHKANSNWTTNHLVFKNNFSYRFVAWFSIKKFFNFVNLPVAQFECKIKTFYVWNGIYSMVFMLTLLIQSNYSVDFNTKYLNYMRLWITTSNNKKIWNNTLS